MKTRAWKILATANLLALAMFSFTQTAGAQVNYAISGNTAYVTSSPNAAGNIVIASTYLGYPVTSIGQDAFSGCTNLTSVTIPNSVTSIGNLAFAFCSGLPTVTIPSSVTSIGAGIFFHCSALTNIAVNAANPICTSVGGVLFNKNLTTLVEYPGGLAGSYTIPSSVTTILDVAFGGCPGLPAVTIPSSVTSIGLGPFADCDTLTNIAVDAANPSYTNVSGVLFDKALTTLIQYPAGLAGSYTISSSVTSIGDYAFWGCSGLPTVTIPNSVTTIGTGAFELSGLTGVTIPSSVTSIVNYAFYDCSGLTNVAIPNSVTSIGGYAFSYCSSLKLVTIPGSVTSIGSYAFASSGLTNAYFLGNAPSVNGGLGSADTTVFQGETGTAYYVSGTTGWGTTFGGWPTAIVNNTTPATDFTFVTNSGAISITRYTGSGGNVTIPSTINGYPVTTIGTNAFYDLTSLTNVTIPSSVTNIVGSFGECSALTTIDVNTANPSYTSTGGVLFNKTLTALVNYPGGLAGSYAIPGSVTDIGVYAFDGSILTSVTIPNSVTSIGIGAFDFCSGLTSVTIPATVTNIGGYAFNYCTSLTNAYFLGNAPTVNGGLGSADTTVFYGETGTAYYVSGTMGWGSTFGGWPTAVADFTYVTNNGAITITGYTGTNSDVTIPSTISGYPVTTIGTNAFSGSNLTSVTIPSSVTNIVGSFAECSALTNINVDAANSSYTNAGGVLFNKTLTTLVQYPGGLAGSYTIPNSVTSIGNYAFDGCGLTSLTIPNSVTNIGSYAFASSGLTNAYFMGNAPSVDGGPGSADTTVFLNDSGTAYYVSGTTGWGTTFGGWPLAPLITPATDFSFITNNGAITITGYNGPGGNVTIPSTINGYPVTAIGDFAFDAPGLASVTIPKSVTSIGEGAFYLCSSLTYIDVIADNPSYSSAGGVLFNKALTTLVEYPQGLAGSYTIPGSVTSIGNSAFYGSSGMTSVAIPDSVASIGVNAFQYCSGLTNLTIPNNVTSFGEYAFSDCFGLINVTILNGVTSIGDGAFFNCGRLTSVTIPNSVTNISDYAFFYCSGLTSVTIPDSITSIGDSIFDRCSSLRNVTIPNSVTNIGVNAFLDCHSLTSVTIPNSVTSIDVAAFANCWGLTNVTIGNSVTSIGGGAFQDCSGLTSVTIPNSVTSIGAAFSGCSGLTSVAIPNSVTNIMDAPFTYCSALTNIAVDAANPSYASAGGVLFTKTLTTLIQYPGGLAGSYSIPSSVTSISVGAFMGCSGLSNVMIPNSVTSIGEGAFTDCSSLTSMTIPNSVTTISDYTFKNCSGLTSVTIPSSVTSIGAVAFDDCSGLTSVMIPSSVTSIGGDAFLDCYHLTEAFFLGNAPTVNGGPGSADTTVFLDDSGEAYYVPGTTGWGATFGGWPTATWYQPQPQILGAGYGLGVGNQGFQFTISWATNATVVVDASTNLQNWIPISTNTLVNGTSTFLDSAWTNHPQRFYRVRPQ